MKKSAVAKRSIVIDGHKTSISLEEEFWDSFKSIAEFKGIFLSTLASHIDAERNKSNLSSQIRLYVLLHYKGRAQHV